MLDVDGDHGRASLAELERTYAPLPLTLTATTGRGMHFYFDAGDRRIPNSAGRLGAGLDVRGHGGYIVVPPSQHADGCRYRWNSRRAPPPLPSWLADLLAPPARAPIAPAPTPPVACGRRARYPLAQAVADGIVKTPVIGEVSGAQVELGDTAFQRNRQWLDVAVERWRMVHDTLSPAGKRPVLFVMCENTLAADEAGDSCASSRLRAALSRAPRPRGPRPAPSPRANARHRRLYVRGKGGTEREVPIPEETLTALEAWLASGCRRGQRERTALGVPAYRPAIVGVDDRPAQLADTLEGRGQVCDGEVRKRSRIAGTRPRSWTPRRSSSVWDS